MKRALLWALLALTGLVAPGCFTPAQAALTLCNRTSYILYAATSAMQSPRSETTGWTRIAPGDCRLTRKEPLTAETYLVHARSSIAHSGPARAWGGDIPVCVKDGNFTLRRGAAQASCTADTFPLAFAPVNNRGKSVWVMHFDEKPAMNMTEAQLAGVKRLLKDNTCETPRVWVWPNMRPPASAVRSSRSRLSCVPLLPPGSPKVIGTRLFTARSSNLSLTALRTAGSAERVSLSREYSNMPRPVCPMAHTSWLISSHEA